MRISQWDDWYSLEATARQWDEGFRESGERAYPQMANVGLWLPLNTAGGVAHELTALDIDLRKGSTLLPTRFYAPRAFPFAPLLNLAEPINELDGRLEVETAQRDESLQIDLTAVGLIISVLVDTPTLFFMLRAAMHRLPFRIRIERRDAEEELDYYPEAIEGHFSDRQAEAIEAQRIARRITLDHVSGSRIQVEEFE